METWGNTWWPVFLIISAIWVTTGFGIAETIAILQGVGSHLDNTLSHYARTDLGLSVAVQNTKHTVAWWCSFVVWMIFVVWITAHIWFFQFG
jgi:hypothetical protein